MELQGLWTDTRDDDGLMEAARRRLELRRDQLAEQRASLDIPGWAELRQVEETLSWMAAGEFGRCSICHEPLTRRQIERTPHLRTCRACVLRPGTRGRLK